MLKIFLLTRNDTKFLEDWILYHGFLFGLDNLHILDGSDCQKAIDTYAKFKPLGLNVHFSSSGLNDLADEMTQLMHTHKGTDNFLIKLDTDEFIALADTFLMSLPRLLVHGIKAICFRTRPPLVGPSGDFIRAQIGRLCANGVVHTEGLKEFLTKLPVTGQRYKAAFTTCSIPTDQPVPRPARSLTNFYLLEFTQFKTFFHSSNFISVDLGCHRGVSSRNEGVIPTALTIIHYQDTSVDDTVERARQVLISHRYIANDDSVEQQCRKLRQLTSAGSIPSFHKVKLYLLYLESKIRGETLDPASLFQQNSYFRTSTKKRHRSLVQDTLAQINNLSPTALAASLRGLY
jgi:hypothetical protein